MFCFPQVHFLVPSKQPSALIKIRFGKQGRQAEKWENRRSLIIGAYILRSCKNGFILSCFSPSINATYSDSQLHLYQKSACNILGDVYDLIPPGYLHSAWCLL